MSPQQLQTLDELMSSSDTAEVPIRVFVGDNLGNRTFSCPLPMYDFFNRSSVDHGSEDGDNAAQRRLDPMHAKKLAVYVLRGFLTAAIRKREIAGLPVQPRFHEALKALGEQAYTALQPIVVNLRNCKRDGADLRGRLREAKDTGEALCFEFYLSQKDILWVVDGQHRRWALELVFQFLKDVRLFRKYPRKSLFPGVGLVSDGELEVWNACAEVSRQCTINIELHLGLGLEEERQLFHDLNNLGKKVEASLSFDFDNSNPVNAFIKEELINKHIVRVVEKDVVNWKEDTGAISRKDLVAVNAHLFLNKSNISGAVPPKVDPKHDYAKKFWQVMTSIQGFGEEGAKANTVAAQPVVMKALAKLSYDFAWGKSADPTNLEKLFDGITEVNFGHDNAMWRYFEFTEKERKQHGLTGLTAYLPTTQGNRDIGQYQAGVMRFGAKHNDIYPIIGDMIRWQLELPNRHLTIEDLIAVEV